MFTTIQHTVLLIRSYSKSVDRSNAIEVEDAVPYVRIDEKVVPDSHGSQSQLDKYEEQGETR